MSVELTNEYNEILKLLEKVNSIDELKEIKSLLARYFFERTVHGANSVVEESDLSQEVFDKWKSEHFRRAGK